MNESSEKRRKLLKKGEIINNFFQTKKYFFNYKYSNH